MNDAPTSVDMLPVRHINITQPKDHISALKLYRVRERISLQRQRVNCPALPHEEVTDGAVQALVGGNVDAVESTVGSWTACAKPDSFC